LADLLGNNPHCPKRSFSFFLKIVSYHYPPSPLLAAEPARMPECQKKQAAAQLRFPKKQKKAFNVKIFGPTLDIFGPYAL